MKTRWLPLQVQSSYTVLSLNASFLKGMFHHNFTPEHNNSLLSIIGYTLSIQCRLSSLPFTTLLPACAEPGFTRNVHGKRKVETRSQVPRLKSHSTGSLLRHTGNRQHCSDTNWSWRWQEQDLQLPFHLVSEVLSTGEVVRTSSLWIVLSNHVKQMVLREPSHLTANPTEACQVQQTVHLTRKNKAKKNSGFISQPLRLLQIKGFIQKTNMS